MAVKKYENESEQKYGERVKRYASNITKQENAKMGPSAQRATEGGETILNKKEGPWGSEREKRRARAQWSRPHAQTVEGE